MNLNDTKRGEGVKQRIDGKLWMKCFADVNCWKKAPLSLERWRWFIGDIYCVALELRGERVGEEKKEPLPPLYSSEMRFLSVNVTNREVAAIVHHVYMILTFTKHRIQKVKVPRPSFRCINHFRAGKSKYRVEKIVLNRRVAQTRAESNTAGTYNRNGPQKPILYFTETKKSFKKRLIHPELQTCRFGCH